VVWNNDIKEPIAVRYDWADNPDGNLKKKVVYLLHLSLQKTKKEN
jgi:hypothetical protein